MKSFQYQSRILPPGILGYDFEEHSHLSCSDTDDHYIEHMVMDFKCVRACVCVCIFDYLLSVSSALRTSKAVDSWICRIVSLKLYTSLVHKSPSAIEFFTDQFALSPAKNRVSRSSRTMSK